MLSSSQRAGLPARQPAARAGGRAAVAGRRVGGAAHAPARHTLAAPPRATAATADTGRFIPRWSACFEFLRGKRLETVTPEAASRLVDSGEWVLVDVRRADQAAASSPAGAVNVPLYRKLELLGGGGFDATRLLKSVMYAFNGVDPIEPNPVFVEMVAELSEGGKKGLIFACEAGGTMKPSTNFAEGKASRSLQACYKAMAQGGFSNVKHLDRGIYGWYQADLPFTGNYKPEIGRFPSAASEPTLMSQISESKGYEVRGGDKEKE